MLLAICDARYLVLLIVLLMAANMKATAIIGYREILKWDFYFVKVILTFHLAKSVEVAMSFHTFLSETKYFLCKNTSCDHMLEARL